LHFLFDLIEYGIRRNVFFDFFQLTFELRLNTQLRAS
jgi:hypothetical protein